MASSRKVLEKAAVVAFDRLRRAFEKRDVDQAEKLGERLALLVRRFDKKHADRTLQNLSLALPDWDMAKRSEVSIGMYRHFGRVLSEFMRTGVTSDEQVLASTEVIGLHYLEEAESLNRGVIAITGHFGNWERMAHWCSASHRTLTVIARDANQSALNERVNEIRRKSGTAILSRGSAARGALSMLKKGEMIGLLPDQNTDELFIPFFGKPCGTVKGPGVFYVRTGAPVIPIFYTWQSRGKYRLEFMAPLQPMAGYEPVEGMMRAINAALESKIREYPEQWLWMHDRWKSAREEGLL